MPYKDRESQRLGRTRIRAAMSKFLQEYKVLTGCLDCGYNSHHAGLEFDHLNDKFKNIGSMLEYSMSRVLDEIAKCEVVCGTCHNIRTYNRKHGV